MKENKKYPINFEQVLTNEKLANLGVPDITLGKINLMNPNDAI